MQTDPEHLNLRILLSYQDLNQVCLLQLTLWQFSCRHRSILSVEEEATPFQQVNGFKLLYKLHLPTQSFSHLSVSITFGFAPSNPAALSVVSGQLPPMLTLLLCALNLPVPPCHSPLLETAPKCGILLLAGDCNHLQDCSGWIAVGPAKYILAEGGKARQSRRGRHLHRAGRFGYEQPPSLPQPHARCCRTVTKHSLAGSAQPRYFVPNQASNSRQVHFPVRIMTWMPFLEKEKSEWSGSLWEKHFNTSFE